MELSGVVLGLYTTKSSICYDFMEFFYYRPSLGQRIIIRVNNINAAWNKKNSSALTLCWYSSTWNLYYKLNQQQYLLRITQDCVCEIRPCLLIRMASSTVQFVPGQSWQHYFASLNVMNLWKVATWIIKAPAPCHYHILCNASDQTDAENDVYNDMPGLTKVAIYDIHG